jgi:hypothetical protein
MSELFCDEKVNDIKFIDFPESLHAVKAIKIKDGSAIFMNNNFHAGNDEQALLVEGV